MPSENSRGLTLKHEQCGRYRSKPAIIERNQRKMPSYQRLLALISTLVNIIHVMRSKINTDNIRKTYGHCSEIKEGAGVVRSGPRRLTAKHFRQNFKTREVNENRIDLNASNVHVETF